MTARAKEHRIRVHLLGRFLVEVEGQPIPPESWKRKRPVELLTQIALASGHALHKEEIIDRLWPDKDLAAGANNLYRTLHELRQKLGSEAVALDRDAVRFSSDIWVDVDAFEAAVNAGDAESLGRAIDLYRGPLLPDDPYSDGLNARREHLRQRFVDAGLRLAKLQDGDTDKQVDALRRLLRVDATLEEAHRHLMVALARAGRKNDALQQFKECAAALRDQLDVMPGPETRKLKETIERQPANGTATEPRRADWRHIARRLVGRDTPGDVRGRNRAVAEMNDFVDGARGVLLIIGEAGLGKSRLAAEGARRAQERGAVLMAGMGDDFEGTAPYTPFVDAWSDLLRTTGRPIDESPFFSFRPVPGASAQEDRLRLFQSVEQSVQTLAGDGSLFVVIEDLHQADESSLHLFHYLARATSHLPLMLVGTVRDEEVEVGSALHTLLSALRRERIARRVVLERLDREATAELIQDIRGRRPPSSDVDAVYALAGGNPYYTEEVVQAMGERSSDDVVSALPADLLDSVRQRVANLGPDAERLLVAASAIGQRFDFETACGATGMDSSLALDALEQGLLAKVIEEEGHGAYRFRHALTRDALWTPLTHARRVFLHRSVAEALERRSTRDEQSEALAFHHREAGQLDRALPYLLAAIERAKARLGFGEALVFCGQALEVMDAMGTPAGPERLALLLSSGSMRVALGDLDAAIRDLDLAASLRRAEDGWVPSATDRAKALRIAALALIEGGQLEQAEARLHTALEGIGEHDDNPELGSLYYQYSQLRWHQARHKDAYDLAEKCLKIAERQDDAQAIARGFEMLALACHSLGEWREGREYEDKRRELADGTLDVASAFDVHL